MGKPAVLRAILVSALLSGCGAATPAADAPSSKSDGAPSSGGDAPLGATAKKLQGNWEIVKYTSDKPIPNEAMPLMADLFDVLRLRFDGSSAIVKAGKAPEERSSFEIADEQGSDFKMVAKGGMFDGARCRFLGDDQWEVTDKGDAWPGVSVLKRVP
jgi:hypothetical protein